jgi:hypothetical protein
MFLVLITNICYVFDWINYCLFNDDVPVDQSVIQNTILELHLAAHFQQTNCKLTVGPDINMDVRQLCFCEM